METEVTWVVRFDHRNNHWVIELAHGADRIRIPGSHISHQQVMQQAQMLYRASLIPIVELN